MQTQSSPGSRRTFLQQVGLGALGALALKSFAAVPAAAPPPKGRWSSSEELLRAARAHRKIDSHAHIGFGFSSVANLLKAADKFNVQRLAISVPRGANPTQFKASNDLVLQAMREHPTRFVGQCFVDPRFPKEALEEVKRCLGEGMAGLGELYAAAKANDPLYYPIIEYCISQKVPMLWHARADLGLRMPQYPTQAPPGSSIAADFVDIAKRYPESIFIHGHIGGGGDWEYMCKMLRDTPSVFLDTSGSVSEPGMIQFAIEQLGVDRLLFATDMNFETGTGKLLAARLNDDQMRRICWDNFNNILKKRGLHAN